MFAGSAYRRLWSARTVSQSGDTFNFVALALLIYDLTGSGLGVSGVVVAEILPVLLIAPFAGPLVDRWPRVPVMVGSDLFDRSWRSSWRCGTTPRWGCTWSPSACRSARSSSTQPPPPSYRRW